ncbi:ATP-binding protein [Devosia rhodophyticola]|uniref:histidine kinase n=1 Tax=Devosia rhodophyticola TaxID=3026423 RepID=A0ABY7YYP9_9HYPH|nr:PAS domain-containing sensor histidine kinase [Devosia rhodophyticola]WDR06376.1 ATP-binding protein [Devosia rhodophyticola]
MRSADISGAGAEGFGSGSQANGIYSNATNTSSSRIAFCHNPVPNAVAFTAIGSAGLFIIYDIARTSAEVGSMEGIWQRAMVVGLLAVVLIGAAMLKYGPRPDASQRASFQTLVGAIPLGVACWTATGNLIVCNDQYRSRLNLATGSFRGAVSYHDAVTQLIRGGYMKLINEDDDNRLLELHRQDGSCLLIDERPLETGGFITLVSDVTERKKTDMLLNAIREEQRLLARRYHEEKLKAEAASRSKTNFLAHLSHDIRTPLNHIIGFAELMAHETYGALGDPRYREYIQTIKSSGEGLLASFATILDLAELESGQKVLRSEPLQVDELIESSVLRYRGQAARAGIEFCLGECTQAIISADKLALQRMLGNLIDNSLRFTPQGGTITVAAYAANDGVVIEVSDTGLGMTEDRLESLQQPFALGDARFTREGVGPGLGISISRAIAELSGGRMAIDSSPAMGTTVAISLPAVEGDTSVMQAAE